MTESKPSKVKLTRRQRDILAALRAGPLSRDELAAALVVERNTINDHLCKLFRIAGVHSIDELMAWGQQLMEAK